MKKITLLTLAFLIFHISFSQSSDCPTPQITSWTMTADGVSFDGNNQSEIIGYEIHYSTTNFSLGDDVNVYEFDSFPHTITGLLNSATTYYMTIRSVCGDDDYSDWEQNPNNNGNGPDAYTTTTSNCPDEYELPIVWRDNFECYTPFAIDNIEGWTVIDGEGGITWGASDVDFTNEAYVGAGIIWNQLQAVPVNVGGDINGYAPYEGNQGLYFFASGANQTTYPNDDWMISPEFTIDGVTSPTLNFWAKSITDAYGLDRFRIGVGTSTNPADFTIISYGNYEEAPTEWTQYEYDLSAYEGQTVRVGIHCVSNDSFVLQMDAFVVEGTLGISDTDSLQMSLYPNPTDGSYVTIQTPFNGVKEVQVFDILGKRVINTNLISDLLDISKLNAGLYMVKVTVDNQTKISKLIIE